MTKHSILRCGPFSEGASRQTEDKANTGTINIGKGHGMISAEAGAKGLDSKPAAYELKHRAQADVDQ